MRVESHNSGAKIFHLSEEEKRTRIEKKKQNLSNIKERDRVREALEYLASRIDSRAMNDVKRILGA